MQTRIDLNIQFTTRAIVAMDKATYYGVNFQAGPNIPFMHVGDLFSSEDTMPHVFVVTRRHFHWMSGEHLQIDYTMDVQPS